MDKIQNPRTKKKNLEVWAYVLEKNGETAKALKILAKKNAIDMPISDAVDEFLTSGADIGSIIERVLDRPLRRELL